MIPWTSTNELPLEPTADLPLARRRMLRVAGYLTHGIGVQVAERLVIRAITRVYADLAELRGGPYSLTR